MASTEGDEVIPPRHTPDAALHFRARMYRSRYPTLRTVRIAGDGSVWVDGTRRVIYYRHDSGSIHYPAQPTGEFRTWALRAVAGVADAMEVVR